MRTPSTLVTVLLACSFGCSDGGGSHPSTGGTTGSASASGGNTSASNGGSTQSTGTESPGDAGASGGSSASPTSSSATSSGGSALGGTGGSRGGAGGTTPTGGSAGAGTGGRTQGTGGTGGAQTGATGGGTPSTGGSTGLTTADPNVVSIIADSGPTGSDYVNGPFATVTLCEPGTTNCQNIDHLLIDTGSTGIRVLASKVKLNLPAANSTAGKPLAECLPFMSGTAWGEVRSADVKIGGMAAPNLRVQLIGASAYPLANDCTGDPINDSASLNSNGILGIGLDVEDCGAACNRKTGNAGLYYECSSKSAGGCAVTTVAPADQIRNPIVAFASDNNGSFMQFPSIPVGGVVSQTGFLVFGIGTRPNNQLGNAKVIPVDPYGQFDTTFNGAKYSGFIDSGSNGMFFLSTTTSKIPTCTTGAYAGFYCPTSTMDLTATMPGKTGAVTVNFAVGNASKFSLRNYVIAELGGPMFEGSYGMSMPGFDWGFSFHLGRTVFCAISGKTTPAGAGPFFAF